MASGVAKGLEWGSGCSKAIDHLEEIYRVARALTEYL